MARPLRLEYPGALYFVSARSVPRHRLFRTPDDWADFAGRLTQLVDAFGVEIHGYCLLPSEYNLLVGTPGGNLSRALHRLNSGYTATVNARRHRSGPLLQSRYRSLLLDEDPWLLRLSVYLHLEPVRLKLATDPLAYGGSSAPAFVPGGRPLPGVATGRVLARAGGPEGYASLLRDSAATPPPSPWKEVWKRSVLGGKALQERVAQAVGGLDAREIAGFTARREGVELDRIVALVAENTGVGPREILRSKFQRLLARKMAIHLARRFTGMTLREIGAAFGVDYTTVHMVSRRVEELIAGDEGVASLFRALEAELAAESTPPEPAAAPEPEADLEEKKKASGEKKKRDSQLTLF